MVTIRVSDGIGNQLFQYALGYALKKRINKAVAFDTSFYNVEGLNGATKRDLLLNNFNLTAIDTVSDTENRIPSNVVAKVQRFYQRRFLPYYKWSYIVERKLLYNPNILEIGNNVYLDGYWHSYKYFEGLEHQLRPQLSLKAPLSTGAQQYSNQIQNQKNTVSIHIRRNDYISKYNSIFHNQDIAYYDAAIKYIAGNLKNGDITLIVFSDDIVWCEQNLNFAYKTIFVKDTQTNPCEDLVLMSYCEHNIIANSTFSWWGAFANKNSQKIVVAPKFWFKNQNDNSLYTQSIYPPSWICL